MPPETKPGTIEDLQYIKILVSSYSDDPDPEDDGIAIDLMFYDSKSEEIEFRNNPVQVHVELFGYRGVQDTFDHEKMKLVYKTSITVDHSITLKERFGKYIRIPYDETNVDESKYYRFGTVKVSVEISQGSFADIADLIPIYAVE